MLHTHTHTHTQIPHWDFYLSEQEGAQRERKRIWVIEIYCTWEIRHTYMNRPHTVNTGDNTHTHTHTDTQSCTQWSNTHTHQKTWLAGITAALSSLLLTFNLHLFILPSRRLSLSVPVSVFHLSHIHFSAILLDSCFIAVNSFILSLSF